MTNWFTRSFPTFAKYFKRGSTDELLRRQEHHWWHDADLNGFTGIVTEDTAMKYAAFYAAVDRIASDIAKLPIHVYQNKGRDFERAPSHPVQWLLHDQPNQYQTPYIFKQTMVGYLLRWGNAYAEIQMRGDGRPAALHVIPPQYVRVLVNAATDEYFYEIRPPNQPPTRLDLDRMFHLRMIGDGMMGLSPVALFRTMIGMGLSAEEAGKSFFDLGMRPCGVFSVPNQLSPEAFNRLRGQLEQYNAGAKNTGRMLLAEQGAKVEQWSIPPEDAQLIESRTFTVQDICRIFHLPPHKLQDLSRATFSNVEELDREYVGDCLQPHFTNFEQEANCKLFLPGEQAKFYVKFSVEAMLRGKSADRAALYKAMFEVAALSPNEIRALEDMPSLGPDGDKHYRPLNLQAVEDPPPPPAAPPSRLLIGGDEPGIKEPKNGKAQPPAKKEEVNA